MRFSFIFLLMVILSLPQIAFADETTCSSDDTSCLFTLLEDTTSQITEDHWRDSTYRELAKLLTSENRIEPALALIDKINSPDTQAMTIRGIGMSAAELDLSPEARNSLFSKLKAKALEIEHPPSFAIALTYIAMSQAFAGDDSGAMETASTMENPALRNKAYAESAEIQAERNDHLAATASIDAINDPAFKDKALRTVSKILADKESYAPALKFAEEIGNSYQKAQAVLYILVRQISPEEVSIQ